MESVKRPALDDMLGVDNLPLIDKMEIEIKWLRMEYGNAKACNDRQGNTIYHQDRKIKQLRKEIETLKSVVTDTLSQINVALQDEIVDLRKEMKKKEVSPARRQATTDRSFNEAPH